MKAARRLPAGGLLLCLLSCVVLLAGCGGEEITPPRHHGDDADRRAAAATATLRDLQRGLADDDRTEVVSLAAPDARSRAALSAIYANDTALHLADVAFRYVDVDSTSPPARLGSYGAAAFGATVTVSWRIAGYDTGISREDARFSFVQTAQGARLAEVGGGDDRTPLWLATLTVTRQAHSLTAVAAGVGSSFDAIGRQAERAVSDVRRVLPRWHGRLVVEVPPSEATLEQVLHADQGQYAAIAGVTTTVDGTLVDGSPVHVFLNPQVYGGLGARGQQVVLSHETTHLATKAPFAQGVPTWLLEGFADYVALAHADVPLATAASQIIARVRAKGPPAGLPTTDDLSPDAPGLGATYEEAWTICRYLARRYGEAALVHFYDAVGRGTTTERAFAGLGTSQRTFVAGWRADLRAIAAGRAG